MGILYGKWSYNNFTKNTYEICITCFLLGICVSIHNIPH